MPERPTSRAALLLVTLIASIAIAGCGDSEDDPSKAAPSAASFPPAEGKTLPELASGVNEAKLVASPAGQVWEVGENRYSFGVFTLGKKQVTDAEVALYFAHGKTGKARGPFPARVESLQTDPAYRAQTSVAGSEDTTAVYVVPKVNFTKPGEWRVIALFRTEDGLQGTLMPSAVVGRFPEVPDVGDKAPIIHTPTVEDVRDLAEIDTRIPPDQMHEVDFADVLGEKPIVLVFATPQFCESRVCGPVVDVAEQARDEAGQDVAFIHMEVFNENDPSKGVRPQLKAFGLPTEPWLFVIDGKGVIKTRIEGAFSADEVRQAVLRVSNGKGGQSQ